MRFALIALISAVAALAQPAALSPRTVFSPRPLNPPSVLPGFEGWGNTPAKRAPATNAERFALGLTPLKPKSRRHRGGPHSGYLSGGTRVRSAPRAETSPLPPVSVTCNLVVKDTDGLSLGYVSPTWNDYGEYGATQQSPEGALSMTFSYPADSPSQLNMVAINSPDSKYPNVGAVVGFSSDSSDLKPGEFSYVYLTGTETIPSGPPQSANSAYRHASGFDDGAESAIWNYDPSSQSITPQWINTDGSTDTNYVALIDNVFIMTGDTGVASALGDAKFVKFSCEPVVSQPL
ncbi:hypothetical protein RhiJN_21387 [Ceratobasidium sp. AG-Ba]|nr:hypothetical protein RhiJN_21387 [Ceratobasidium sp. AG-Ba]